jgi:hypothetical protein
MNMGLTTSSSSLPAAECLVGTTLELAIKGDNFESLSLRQALYSNYF